MISKTALPYIEATVTFAAGILEVIEEKSSTSPLTNQSSIAFAFATGEDVSADEVQ